ncbi:MAG: Rpn family recombination-promoting nuclease/putative transposase, partial [Bacteroidia bacterium]|nr:Rpn family recombination-promoting nuclease/putative transposase [Bacteroidia bacterium]
MKQGWVEKIEESNITRVDKSFILQDFKDKEADLVYWVKLSEQDVIFYVLMEMQSTVDFQMPYRLLV